MFCSKFLNNLWQPPKDNPWPSQPMNQNYRTWFQRLCDYMLGFQVERKISESILLWKWPKNVFDVENNAYKTSIFAYIKKLDFLILVSCITKSNVEEESSPPYLEDATKNLKEEMMNSKDTTSTIMPLWVPTNWMTHQ